MNRGYMRSLTEDKGLQGVTGEDQGVCNCMDGVLFDAHYTSIMNDWQHKL